jgi:hypothetical protein
MKNDEEMMEWARLFYKRNNPDLYWNIANHHYQIGYEQAIDDLDAIQKNKSKKKTLDIDGMPRPSQFIIPNSTLCDSEAWNKAYEKWAQEQLSEQ